MEYRPVPFDTLGSLWTVLAKLNTVTKKPITVNEYFQECENTSAPAWFDRLMLKRLPEEPALRKEVLEDVMARASHPDHGKLLTFIEEDLGGGADRAASGKRLFHSFYPRRHGPSGAAAGSGI